MKQRAAQEVGIGFRHCALPAEATAEALIETVKSLNADENVSGILVQLPLDENILPKQEREVTETGPSVPERTSMGMFCLSLRNRDT